MLTYAPHGDLNTHLRQEGTFSENKAKFYLMEVLMAIEALHERGIVYRDLKPDNILIGEDNHIMLTDFGLSKEGIEKDDLTRSFCGSYAYLAPEMVEMKGHGQCVDWYLLGVLLYEMLVGHPPYFSYNKEILFENIR